MRVGRIGIALQIFDWRMIFPENLFALFRIML